MQTVKIGKYKSEKRILKKGVPQGTILGPMLFLIYINDIFSLISEVCIVSYADDTTILRTSKTRIEA